MPIFELIGAALDFTPLNKYTEEYHLTNSSYSSIIGDNTAFIIGGGRNTNIYGTDVKLVIDWEEFIINLATGGNSSLPSLSNSGMKWLGFLFGIGGDTGLLVGNKSDFKYWGEDFSVARQRHEFKCTVPQSNHHEVPVPLPVKIALGLGTIGLLLASLIARFEFGLYSTASATQYPLNTSIVATVIPAFETRWLFTMKFIEYGISFLSATESALMSAESSLESAKSALVTAEGKVKTLTSAVNIYNAPADRIALENTQKEVKTLAENVKKSEATVANATAARAAAMTALMGSAAGKAKYESDLKDAAAAKAKIPITTQITADQYGIICNTFTLNDNKSLIKLVSSDSKSVLALPAADVSGSIILESSTISLNSKGNSFINMIGGMLNPDPSISLSTTGINSSEISLVANATGNPLGGSIVANTGGVNISYGIKGNEGIASITNKAINLSVGVPDVGPSITITPESIIFRVGEATMTMTAQGIFMVAPAVGVACGQTNIVINEIGIVEQIGENSRILNDEGHSLSAAETELNVGVEGLVSEAPTMAVEFEASSELSATENSITGDAMLSLEAAIIMSE
ncbi:MAG: hypothetical protein NTZ71_19005 [Planctomycetota bacterium]|nr:hypothetical protein [Planctomycetota bacterium]